jgi:hypothetical protein
MIDCAGMHSYFWLVSPSPVRRPVWGDVDYTTAALQQDLGRVRSAWDDCQSSRDRDAIYSYLTAVFDLVAWWAAEDRAVEPARKALRLHSIGLPDHDEPFAAIIRCTADPAKVDKRTRSKWSRVMRYALTYKSDDELLEQFIKRKGGINKCADRFTRCLRRRQTFAARSCPDRRGAYGCSSPTPRSTGLSKGCSHRLSAGRREMNSSLKRHSCCPNGPGDESAGRCCNNRTV